MSAPPPTSAVTTDETAITPAPSLPRGAEVALRLAGLLPYRLVGAPLSRYVVERNILVWRTQWVALIAGLVEPLLFLLVMGVGVGGLVGEDPRVGSDYGQFVAAGLLGSAAMNAPMYETYNVFFKLKGNLYEAIGATPADPSDIAIGEVLWIVARVGLYAAGFMLIAALLGLVDTPWALLAIPISLLIGLAFATVTMAATTFMRSWHDFDFIQVAVVPMFLFSATFYPIDVLPEWARLLTRLSPLYHGVAALRQSILGEFSVSIVGNLLVLVVISAISLRISRRRFATLLRS